MHHSNQPLVTIGIPTYNRADGYLRQCLESALSQSYQNLEVIVSDNASSDGTSELLASYDDPRLRYIRHSENIGANNNFNHCVQEATGEYFMLLHDDDFLDSDFVSACVEALNQHGGQPGLIRTGVRVVDGSNQFVRENTNDARQAGFVEFVEDWVTHKTALYLCNTLFLTSALKALNGFHSPTDLYQDVVAYLELAKSHGCANVREVKANFRRHDANRGTASELQDWLEDSVFVVNTVKRLAGDEGASALLALKKFLCLLNYRRVAGIANPMVRWWWYVKLYATFGLVLSPVPHVRATEIRPTANALRRRPS